MTLASYIDHSVLRPDATTADIVRGAHLCADHQFAAYCVNSSNVHAAVTALRDSAIPVAATVAFPFGSATTIAKTHETSDVIRLGAQEIDMVANIGWMLDGNWRAVAQDIKEVVAAAAGSPVKVIIETGYLTRQQIAHAIEAIATANAAYVKNSTGYGPKGAELQEMAWIREVTPAHLGVKAAGGIRTHAQALRLVEHGVNRIGTSSGPALLREEEQ